MGAQGAHIRKSLGCPAYGKTCSKCKKLGHFEIACRAIAQPYQSASAIARSEPEEVIIGGITQPNNRDNTIDIPDIFQNDLQDKH